MSSLIKNSSSSYYQFQQSLDQYVYFSPLTMGGASGRAVKIHKDLFLPFFCVVDPATHDGQSIIRQIENLRTTCTIVRKETGSGYANNPRQGSAHLSRLKKLNDAFHQVLIIKNLHVHYRVSQENGDKAPSVYISSIRQVTAASRELPGLYESNRFGDSEKIDDGLKVDGRKVYITCSSESPSDALYNAFQATKEENTIAFYAPSKVNDDLGLLGSKNKSTFTKTAIQELSNIFNNTKNFSKGVTWYAEGEGVNLLAEAIKQVRTDLAKHKFRFINPIANTAKLITALSDKKAKFEGDFFHYDRNKNALILIGAHRNSLLNAIGKLPAGKNYDIITRNHIMNSIKELPSLGKNVNEQKSQLTKPAKTFIQSLRAAGVYRK